MGMPWYQFRTMLYENAKKKRIPIVTSFELTARCNFHCKMCYICRFADDKEVLKKELTTEQWIRIGKEARDAGVFFVTLTGGEIFLRKDFKQLYEAFSNMGLNITLYTNGSLITEEMAQWLSRVPPAKVSITLYGASADTYEKVTGHRDGFERTIRGIKALTANKIQTELKTTMVKANQYEYDDMIQLANNLGIKIGVVNYVGPRREDICTDPHTERLDPVETANYEKKHEDYVKEHSVQLNNPETTSNALSEPSNSAFKCSAGRYACWFTWDGKMIPCGLLPVPALDIMSRPVSEAWNELKTKCAEIPQCHECEDCELYESCMACPARLYLETGSFDRKAPYLCETAQCRADLHLEYKHHVREKAKCTE